MFRDNIIFITLKMSIHDIHLFRYKVQCNKNAVQIKTFEKVKNNYTVTY